MASFINAITTSGGGIETSADASGVLELKTDGVTALTVDASQNVVLTNPLPVASGGSGLTSVGVACNIMVSDGTTLVSNTLAQAAIVAVADIGTTVQAFDATIVVDADIGVSVQAFDATILTNTTAISGGTF